MCVSPLTFSSIKKKVANGSISKHEAPLMKVFKISQELWGFIEGFSWNGSSIIVQWKSGVLSLGALEQVGMTKFTFLYLVFVNFISQTRKQDILCIGLVRDIAKLTLPLWKEENRCQEQSYESVHTHAYGKIKQNYELPKKI